MTPTEFSVALARTECRDSLSVRAAYDSLVLGMTMYRASKNHKVSESSVHRTCRRILAAHAMQECPLCHRPY